MKGFYGSLTHRMLSLQSSFARTTMVAVPELLCATARGDTSVADKNMRPLPALKGWIGNIDISLLYAASKRATCCFSLSLVTWQYI